MHEIISASILLIFGFIIMMSGILNVDFIYSGAKGKMLIKLLGEIGTRILHVLLGLFGIALGLLALFNVIELN